MGTYLVTGAAGFVGSHVVECLAARGDRVVAVDCFDDYYDPAWKRRTAQALSDAHRYVWRELDVCDPRAMDAVVSETRPDVIVHLAALPGVRASVGQSVRYLRVNAGGTANVLEVAAAHGVRHVVVASTSSVYGRGEATPFVESMPCDRPLAPYPASKRAAELVAHAMHHVHGLAVSVLRFFTVYGPRNRPDMMAYQLLQSVSDGHAVRLFDGGNVWRDWTYVDDVARAVADVAERPGGFRIVNVARGEPMRLADFVATLERISSGRVRVEFAPLPPTDAPRTWADVSELRKLLGWTPSTLPEVGVERLWCWYEAFRASPPLGMS
ncbi:MAG: NAD-dependent epimerase/dehydratase family protein [Myxococcales bacterium]|nr:NAD-dependent epimerase/dehydratase family protein [Myxococcales bacterium]